MNIHPARKIPFEKLVEGLSAEVTAGRVRASSVGDERALYVYTDACVYERAWNPINMLARGLILDHAERSVVATPFPKFFNVGEGTNGEPYHWHQGIPEGGFETFEKMDGSLIILYFWKGMWRTATKGSMNSDQAHWAVRHICELGASGLDLSVLVPGVTYLFEGIYPENRIVVNYGGWSGMKLLAAYGEDGVELSYGELLAIHWPDGVVERHELGGISELLEIAVTLPCTSEGFVLRFANGHRLKIKGDEYCRIHRLVSRITPLAMWEALKAGDDLESLRQDLPEEFWVDFDEIIRVLIAQRNLLVGKIALVCEPDLGGDEGLMKLTDKEVGLMLNQFPADVRGFIFPYRKSGGKILSDNRAREKLYQAIRPTGNKLEGYSPSSSINRVMEELK